MRNLIRYSVSNHYSKRGFVTINTHGDKIPFYNPGMTKDSSIVYCHYPTARGLIQRRDLEYLENDLNIRTMKKSTTYNEKYTMKVPNKSSEEYSHRPDGIFKLLTRAYTNLINKSTVLTNSEFSRKAILSVFKSSHVEILSPPVDVEVFRNNGLESKDILAVLIDEASLQIMNLLDKTELSVRAISSTLNTPISSTYKKKKLDQLKLIRITKVIRTLEGMDESFYTLSIKEINVTYKNNTFSFAIQQKSFDDKIVRLWQKFKN